MWDIACTRPAWLDRPVNEVRMNPLRYGKNLRLGTSRAALTILQSGSGKLTPPDNR